MAIDTGINKLVEQMQRQEVKLRDKTVSDMWGKFATLVRSVPGKSPDEHRDFCARCMAATPEGRRLMVGAEYGPQCLLKCEPLLCQIESVV